MTLPPCIENMGALSTYGSCLDRAKRIGCPTKSLSCDRRILEAGQHLFLESDDPSQVCLVAKGAVSLYNMLRNGRRQIISFKFPGDFVLLGPHQFSFQSVTLTELRLFPLAGFQNAAFANSSLLSKILDAVNLDLSRAYDLLIVVGKGDPRAAVASFLLEMSGRSAIRESESIYLPMLRTDIADYLGLTHETVSRVFSAFKKEGLIELLRAREVRLKNYPLLKSLAGREGRSNPAKPHN